MKPSEEIQRIHHDLQDESNYALIWTYGTADKWVCAQMIYLDRKHELLTP